MYQLLCFLQAFDITVYDKKDDKPEEKAAAIVKKPAATEPAAKAPPVEIKVWNFCVIKYLVIDYT